MNAPKKPPARRRSSTVRGLAAAALLAAAPAVAAIQIEWDFRETLVNGVDVFAPGASARAAVEYAGSWYETNISDSLGAITSTPGTANQYDVNYLDPTSLVGSFHSRLSFNDFEIAADTVRIVIGGTNLDGIGNSVLAVADPGIIQIPAVADRGYRDEMISRGQGDGTAGSIVDHGATDFAFGVGAISFDFGDRAWNTDHLRLPTSGEFDLYSVALHEIGHLFGVGTDVGVQPAGGGSPVSSWDTYVSGSFFVGPAAQESYGGPVPLASREQHLSNSANHSPVASGFEATLGVTGALQEAAFDPSIAFAQRKYLTELDVALLEDIGWEVGEDVGASQGSASAPVAVPIPAWNLGLLAGLLWWYGRRALPAA
ncbi:MAG: hypothetical protein ACU85V_00615 [Gammaproteobacteria bacterium]